MIMALIFIYLIFLKYYSLIFFDNNSKTDGVT